MIAAVRFHNAHFLHQGPLFNGAVHGDGNSGILGKVLKDIVLVLGQGVGDVGRILAVDHQNGPAVPILHLGLGGLHHRERLAVLGGHIGAVAVHPDNRADVNQEGLKALRVGGGHADHHHSHSGGADQGGAQGAEFLLICLLSHGDNLLDFILGSGKLPAGFTV